MRNFISPKLIKQKWLCLFMLSNLFAFAIQAQVKISGKVTNSRGDAAAGVSVSVKNDNAGTSTNADGTYQLNTTLKNGKYTLVFSGVGFKSKEQTITVNGAADVTANAQLQNDALGMDEVVVIGSSLTQTRKQLGNTVNSVSAKQLQNTGSGNIGAALQGKVAGAQITQTSGDPSGGISIRMRGTTT